MNLFLWRSKIRNPLRANFLQKTKRARASIRDENEWPHINGRINEMAILYKQQ